MCVLKLIGPCLQGGSEYNRVYLMPETSEAPWARFSFEINQNPTVFYYVSSKSSKILQFVHFVFLLCLWFVFVFVFSKNPIRSWNLAGFLKKNGKTQNPKILATGTLKTRNDKTIKDVG